VFKSTIEFDIFKGREIQVLLANEAEWKEAIISDYCDSAVSLKMDGQIHTVPVESIRKAKLDDKLRRE
jgi:hypothetical protein